MKKMSKNKSSKIIYILPDLYIRRMRNSFLDFKMLELRKPNKSLSFKKWPSMTLRFRKKILVNKKIPTAFKSKNKAGKLIK